MDLRDANVVVTGASSGIGEATAIATVSTPASTAAPAKP